MSMSISPSPGAIVSILPTTVLIQLLRPWMDIALMVLLFPQVLQSHTKMAESVGKVICIPIVYAFVEVDAIAVQPLLSSSLTSLPFQNLQCCSSVANRIQSRLEPQLEVADCLIDHVGWEWLSQIQGQMACLQTTLVHNTGQILQIEKKKRFQIYLVYMYTNTSIGLTARKGVMDLLRLSFKTCVCVPSGTKPAMLVVQTD